MNSSKHTFSIPDYSAKQRGTDNFLYIDEETATLVSTIYRFLTLLPRAEKHFVFRSALTDILTCSYIFTEEEKISYLSKALCYQHVHHYNIEDLYCLYECFCYKKTESQKKCFVDAIINKDIATLERMIISVPDTVFIYKTFDAFIPHSTEEYEQPNLSDDLSFDKLVKCVDEKLNRIFSNGLSTANWKDKTWDFKPLGFLSIFENWLYDQDTNRVYDHYFFNLYVKGKVLDFVLETIYRCEVTSICETIIGRIERTCANSPVFCTYFQHRYDIFRRIHPQMLDIRFKTTEVRREEQQVATLDPIRSFKTGDEILDKELMRTLFMNLRGHGYIDCSEEEFDRVFSGNLTNRIRWNKGVGTLSAFRQHYMDNSLGSASKPDVIEKMRKIFVLKDDTEPNASSLGQKENETAKKQMGKWFEDIKRERYKRHGCI